MGRITKWRNAADAAPTNPADGGLSGSFRTREFRRQASFVEPSRAAAKLQPFGAPSNGSPEHAFVAYMAGQRSSLEDLEGAASFFCGAAHHSRSGEDTAVTSNDLDKIASGGIASRNAIQTASDKAGVFGSSAEAAVAVDPPEEVSRALAVLSQWRAKARSGRGEDGRQQGGGNAKSPSSAGPSDNVASAAPAGPAASAAFSSVFPLSSAASPPASPSAPAHSATFPVSLAGSPGSPPSDSSPTRTSSTSSSAVPIAAPISDARAAAATALAIMPLMSRHAHARGLVGAQAPRKTRADGADGRMLSAGESGALPCARRGSGEGEKAADLANHSGGIQALSRGWGSAGECDEGQAGRIGRLGGVAVAVAGAGAGMVPPRSHVQALLEDARSRREAYLRTRSRSASLSVSPLTFAPHTVTSAPCPPPATAAPVPVTSRVNTFSRLDIPLSPHGLSSTSPSPSPSPSASLPPPLALYAGANSPPLSLAHIQLLSQKRGSSSETSGGEEGGEAGEGGGAGAAGERDVGPAQSQHHISAAACIAAASTGATGGTLGGAEAVQAWRNGEGQAQRRSGIPPLSPRSSAPPGTLAGDAAAGSSASGVGSSRFPSSRSVDAGKSGAAAGGGGAVGSRARRLMKGSSAQERGLARIGEREESLLWGGAVPCSVSAAAVEAVGRKVAMLEMVRGAPHVVALLCAFEDTQAIHMVLEHCPGGSIADRLASCRAFSEPDAAAVVRQVAAGLAACHEMGVVHRGVRAEAVLLLGQEGSPVDVRLSGFQHATFFEPGHLHTEAVGAPAYRAPEMIQGGYGPPADVWSLGVLLHLLLSARLPFSAASPAALASSILNDPAALLAAPATSGAQPDGESLPPPGAVPPGALPAGVEPPGAGRSGEGVVSAPSSAASSPGSAASQCSPCFSWSPSPVATSAAAAAAEVVVGGGLCTDGYQAPMAGGVTVSEPAVDTESVSQAVPSAPGADTTGVAGGSDGDESGGDGVSGVEGGVEEGVGQVQLSHPAVDLLRRMLEKDPGRRIDLHQVLLHPWIQRS
ncbi:unnamed protein product [Closterium sp. Yama58-4]|nr:unnamed protein product [Closterium sp. Yama58-4]